MTDRRVNMDAESKIEFKETRAEIAVIKYEISEVKAMVQENLAYHKGLDVKSRLKNIEDTLTTKSTWEHLYEVETKIDKKASWKGLCWMSSFVFGLAMLVVAVVKLSK